MTYLALAFLGIATLFYALFAGADFGAGILELFASEKDRENSKKTLYRVMGPIWEANHVWIILVLVILWVGFPVYYNILVVYLHIPLSLMLLGITLRGVAFVFRHYDAIIDDSQKVYDFLFRISSLMTPFFLGIIFGTLINGQINLEPENANFFELYIKPWTHPFSLATGLFYTALCTFFSSVLLIGESNAEQKQKFVQKSKVSTVIVLGIGFVVLLIAYVYDLSFLKTFLSSPFSLTLMGISALVNMPLWKSISKGATIKSRTYVGTQVTLILSALIVALFPNMIVHTNGAENIFDGVANNAVMKSLGINLIIGGSVILPGLFHLMKSFKMIKILK